MSLLRLLPCVRGERVHESGEARERNSFFRLFIVSMSFRFDGAAASAFLNESFASVNV